MAAARSGPEPSHPATRLRRRALQPGRSGTDRGPRGTSPAAPSRAPCRRCGRQNETRPRLPGSSWCLPGRARGQIRRSRPASDGAGAASYTGSIVTSDPEIVPERSTLRRGALCEGSRTPAYPRSTTRNRGSRAPGRFPSSISSRAAPPTSTSDPAPAPPLLRVRVHRARATCPSATRRGFATPVSTRGAYRRVPHPAAVTGRILARLARRGVEARAGPVRAAALDVCEGGGDRFGDGGCERAAGIAAGSSPLGRGDSPWNGASGRA